jgi:signal transduction histidine kinase
MIESLLFLARADGNATAPDPHPLAADPLVREIVEFFTPLAEDSGVTLTVSGGTTLRADESLLRMALVQSIMALHHGSVTATSQVGRGTTFQLVFPDSKTPG